MEQQELAVILQQHGIGAESLVPLWASGRENTLRLTATGIDALALWHRLRAMVDETGFWPILLGGDECLEEYQDDPPHRGWGTPGDLIDAGAQLDVRVWMRERLAEPGSGPEHGGWPEDVGPDELFTIPYDLLTREPLPTVYIALIPTRYGWQVPAYLRYGGWNECPGAEKQVAMFRYWEEIYGAEPVGMARDRVEMRVSRPPNSREGALDLAREQYAYCNDIVDQGTETLEVLAASLMNGTTWFFWWD